MLEGLYPYLVVGSTWLPVTLGGYTICVPFLVYRPAGPAASVLGGELMAYLHVTTVMSHIGEMRSKLVYPYLVVGSTWLPTVYRPALSWYK